MNTVGAYEAKTHLPALLERVAKGEQFTITRHGEPVARLVPVEPGEQVDRKQLVRQIRELGRANSLGGLTYRQLREEGRRF